MAKRTREQIRMMFGGKCAYCGCVLDGKWHKDHMEPVRREGRWIGGVWKKTGTMRRAHNDRDDNVVPACVPCNILKADSDVEGFRKMLTYFAESIPRISTYTHVHHLMRFGKLSIDVEPVVFWFEKFNGSAAQDERKGNE